MSEVFGERANLSDLLDTRESIHVDHVIHKAFIEINEEYTEAAAAQGKFKSLTLHSEQIKGNNVFGHKNDNWHTNVTIFIQ